MRLWKGAAIVTSALGAGALALVLLAAGGRFRVGGFDALYTTTAYEVEGISLLFLLAAVLYLADRVTKVEALIRSAPEANPVQIAALHDVQEARAMTETVSVHESPDVATAAQAEPLIRLRHLTKIYRLGPVEVHALHEGNLDLLAGSVTIILGPSGSGKTTLLNLLGGIDRATSGTIHFGGVNVAGLDDARLVDYRRERVGFVFQFFNLIPSLTARENVALAAELVPHAAEVEKVLRMVGLGDRMDHFPAELSGGEQQRVAIARALVKNPPLLLCDEPTGELDYATGVKILEILKAAAHGDGRAVIVVTHNATIAEMADQVVRLRGGRIDQVTHNDEPVPPSMLRW